MHGIWRRSRNVGRAIVSFLVVGSVVVDVLSESASQPESDVGGQDVRAFAGNLRSTRRWGKRKWAFTTKRMTAAEEATLLATIGAPDGGAFVSCTGNFNNGVAVTCQVLVANREYAKISSTTVKRRLTLALAEV
jgi:hypothetical protein